MTVPTQTALEVPQTGLGQALGLGIQQGSQVGLQTALKNFAEGRKRQEQTALKEQERLRKEQRSIQLGREAGLTEEQSKNLDPTDISQLIRSRAEEKKALARATESQEREKQKFAFQRTGKILDTNEEVKDTLPLLKSSLNQMETAIKEGDLSFFSKDALANLTGIEKFRSPSGALFLSAGKNFFFSTLKGVKGRANQLIEQTLLDALPKIGRDENANLIVTRFMRNEIDLKTKKSQIIDEITDKFINKGQALPANLGSIVSKRMKPIELANQKVLLQDLNKIKAAGKETKQATVNIRLPDGSTGTIPANNLNEALKLGATQL